MSFSVDGVLAPALSMLWELDANRLTPGHDYTIDTQDRARGSVDAANAPLITYVDPAVWQRPTFAAFRRLLDNYTAATGVPERASSEERAEEDAFLAAVCDTDVMRFAYEWLSQHSPMRCSSMNEFSAMLRGIWFQYYSREGCRDSSGFEHVFCGEVEEGMVKGLHNFVQVYVEEGRGNFNYKGYLDVRGEPCRDPPPPEQQLITVRFEWLGRIKPVSSMFVGVSPEFEVALYTMMFVAGKEDLELDLGPYRARIKVYQMAGKIGTAYPELLAVDHSKLGNDAARGNAAAAAAAGGGVLAGGLGFGALKKLNQKQIKNHAKMAHKHFKGKKKRKGYEFEGVDEEEEYGEEEYGHFEENEDANGHVADGMDADAGHLDSSSASTTGNEHSHDVEQTEGAEEAGADSAYTHHVEPTQEAAAGEETYHATYEAPAQEEATPAYEGGDDVGDAGGDEGDGMDQVFTECCASEDCCTIA